MEYLPIKDKSNNDLTYIIMNLMLAIIVIVGSILIIYTITKFTNTKFEHIDNVSPSGNLTISSSQQDVVSSTNSSAMSSSSTSIPINVVTDVMSESTISLSNDSLSREINPTLPTLPILSAGSLVASITQNTKSVYKKNDDITLPSSLSKPDGYIGRDYVCYRGKLCDQFFVSQRPGCMACQVDSRNNGSNKYAGTGTNVMTTCVYGSDADNMTNPNIWTKQMCINSCANMQDTIDK